VAKLRLVQLASVDQLRSLAAEWDDLWRRSDLAAPTARADLIAQWVEHFGQGQRFTALAVQEAGRLVAALPLIGKRLSGVVEVAALPANCWSAAGDLLVDQHAGDEALDELVRGLSDVRWPLLWLEGVNLDAAAWRRLIAAMSRGGVECEAREDYRVGWIDTVGQWSAYEASWSKNHRKNMRKTRERLGQLGKVTGTVQRDVATQQVGPLLRRAFEVENRSWKGPAGTSVVRSSGIFEFFLQQARQLARRGELEIAFLELDGEPIAFEYGYRSKGVYFSHKVGYDERFASYGPGQLLMLELLERFHGDAAVQGVDCLGPLSDAVSRWTTRTYACGRLIAAPRKVVGGALLASYRAARPWLHRWRKGPSHQGEMRRANSPARAN
jgi:CelD/BcsL family acetyltransferase involved in cellulose biosynthesis